MYLIVGLGNPGEKFLNTRHNLGFEVLDALARKLGVAGSWLMEEKFKSQIIKVYEPSAKNLQLLLVKPQTYMNRSGLAVSKLKNFYKLNPENIVVIHDELDIVLGQIKIRLGGSDAGHHGIESLIKELGTGQFVRVRLGIGNLESLSGEHKHRHFNAEKFVVDYFSEKESSKVKSMIKRVVKAVETILEKGLEKAQTEYNQ